MRLKGPSSPLNNLLDREKVDLKKWSECGPDETPLSVPGMPLAVLVARVPDDLPGEGEQLVPPGEHGRHQAADLGGRLVHRNLTEDS